MQQEFEQLKTIGDVASATVVVGTLMTWLPPIAAALTIVWTIIRIYELKTIQKWIKRWRNR